MLRKGILVRITKGFPLDNDMTLTSRNLSSTMQIIHAVLFPTLLRGSARDNFVATLSRVRVWQGGR